jgi:hypothetical protein
MAGIMANIPNLAEYEGQERGIGQQEPGVFQNR